MQKFNSVMIQIDSANFEGSSDQAHCIPLRFISNCGSMGGRPISLGVPLPRGFAFPGTRWVVFSKESKPQGTQTRVLATWPDGSIKWLLVVFLEVASWRVTSDLDLRPQGTRFEDRQAENTPLALEVANGPGTVLIETGSGRFRVTLDDDRIFADAYGSDTSWLGPSGCRLLCTDASGRVWPGRVESLRVEESGPIRIVVAVSGSLGRRTGLRFSAGLSFYAGSSLVRARITVENPGRARHSGGYWDLGDPGSSFLRDLSLELSTSATADRRIEWVEEERGQALSSQGEFLEVYQDSSGGKNWQSRNHINRNGEIPLRFRGYRVRSTESQRYGLRASPVVGVKWKDKSVSCALEEFWQKFPSAIEVQGQRIAARLMPEQFGDLHEIQAGEHNSRVAWLEFGEGGDEIQEGLCWVHDPPVVIVDPEWIEASGVIPFLSCRRADRRVELQSMLSAAIEGERSFFAKREAIDEYGWRHFGDMWADHEEAYAEDPSPVISHYNNQYDLLFGLLVQFLSSGDLCWWSLADPLARHLMNIDIYHTQRDRAAYNKGMFWHTAHYHDAGLCTHRSMSKSMVGKRIPAPGGGPANEHNYASGLLLYHYVTGCAEAKNSVGGLADWVIAMDDGKRHALGVFSDTPTGHASRTTVADYHGPGRGAGNSINALLDGWLAFGEDRYLIKLEELIRRTIHPRDDIEARDLLNAELRWSYTVYLQALVRFLELTRESSRFSDLRSYVREAILHYARWMVAHERMYLDEPERLEYPTETWAAQDLRKGNTLLMAARIAAQNERGEFRDRGMEILDRGWSSLMSFESRCCTRPLALVLQQGYLETYLSGETPRSPREHDGGRDDRAESFEIDEVFIEQRAQVRGLLRSPWKLAGSLPHAIQASRWKNLARQTWPFELLRRWIPYLQ